MFSFFVFKKGLRLLGCFVLINLCLAFSVMAMDVNKGLEIVSLMPQGQVDRITQIIIRFNKDMVELGQTDLSRGNPAFFLDPKPKGEYRWLDTKTLAYILSRPITGSTKIKIKVSKDVTSLDGSTLSKSLQVSVSTPTIEVVEWRPKPGYVTRPDFVIRAIINQPLDLASIQNRAWFVINGQKVKAQVKERELPRWQREQHFLAREYVFTCPQKILKGQKTRFILEPGIMPAFGDQALRKVISAKYKPYKNLKLISWNMNSSPLGGLDPASGLNFKFTNPVLGKDLWKYLSITPSLKKPLYPFSDYPSRWVNLALPFKPRTKYTVTIKPGLKDDYGTTLVKGYSFRLTTGDLSPSLHLPEGPGIMEAKGNHTFAIRMRNIKRFKLGMKFFPADKAVAALEEERTRPWNKKPKFPQNIKPNSLARTIHPKIKPNKLVTYPLNLPKIMKKSLMGGLTLLDIRATWPNYKGKLREHKRRALIQITDLGLSLKVGDDNGLAWVTRLSTGKPLANVALELRDRKNRRLWQGTSNENGLAKLPGISYLKPAKDKKSPWRNPVVYLLAEHQGDAAILPSDFANKLIYSLPSDIRLERPGQIPGIMAHTIFQLPLYQPGQTVNFLTLLRKHGNFGPQPFTPGEIKAWIMDSYGKKIHIFKGTPNEYGSLTGAFKLSKLARLGEYEIYYKINGKELRAGNFRVASFRPPDFKVKLKTPKSHIGLGSLGTAQLESQYLFGKPVTQGQAQLSMEKKKAYFAPKLLKGFAVGDLPLPEEHRSLDPHVGILKAKTDTNGKAFFTLPELKTKPGQPLRLSLTAQVQDASKRAVRTARSIIVHPSSLYLGLKSPVLAKAGEKSIIELASASSDNQKLSAGQVKIIAYRQYWETVREKGAGGYFRYLTQARREKVFETTVEKTQENTKFAFTPSESGTYVLMAEANDKNGYLTRTGIYLWASGSGMSGWKRSDDNLLEMVSSHKQAKVGQNVTIMLKNPFPKATALLTVERLGVSKTIVREVTEPAPVFNIELQEKDVPGIYISALLVRGRTKEPKSHGADLGKPQVRIGCVKLKVNKTTQDLKVTVTPVKEKMRPGQKAEVTCKVTLNDQPQKCQVTLLAVDERVLTAAQGANSYDPRPTFNQLTPLSLLTADLRTIVINRVLDALKGESGAGGGGPSSGIRRKFHPAVFWLGQAKTDESGMISARFTLPDSLTAYRLVAIACDLKGRIGLGKNVIYASQPLQILSALPRFSVINDQFMAQVLLQNLSAKKAKILLEAKGKGLEIIDNPRLEIELEPNVTEAVGFMVKTDKKTKASILFKAQMDEFEDQAEFTFPVISATSLTSMATSGSLKPAKDETYREIPLKLPGFALPHFGDLKVTLAPSLAANLTRPATMLINYPWDCLEQRLSRSVAKAMRLTKASAIGLNASPNDKKDLKALAALIPNFQTSSGGFAYWPDMETADPFLTAYVLLSSSMIQKAKIDLLTKETKRSAENYLLRYLRRTKAPKKTQLSERVKEAFLVWVLAKQGRKVRARLENILTRAKGLSPFGIACLIKAADTYKLKKVQQDLLKQLETTADLTATTLQFVTIKPGGLKSIMGSSLRGNALALWALCDLKPAYPNLDALAAFVAKQLGQKKFLSTQDAVFGVWGLEAYNNLAGDKTDLTLEVALAGRSLSTRRFTNPTDPPLTVKVVRNLLKPGKTQDLLITTQGQGRLLYNARLSFALPYKMLKAVKAPMAVSRFFQAVNGGSQFKLGQEIECVVTLITQATRHHVMLEIPYPSGLEPIGAAKGLQGDYYGPWRYQEMRKTKLLLYAPNLKPGVYTKRFRLRAIASGKFIVPQAKAEEMYSPEVFGKTSLNTIDVQ